MLRLLLASWLVGLAASAVTTPTAKWQTLSGKAPRVVARGGFSGIVPDSSQLAYELAMSSSVKDVILYCNLQMTKDGIGMCQYDTILDNSTDIQSYYPKGQKSYTLNGEQVHGYFSVDFTSEQLFNVSLVQNVFSRPSIFDGAFPLYMLEDLLSLKPPGLWINVESNTFFKQHKQDVTPYIIEGASIIKANYISSPEIGFLKSLNGKLGKAKTKLVLKFLSQDSIEPTIGKSYSTILQDLKSIKAYASGILVPKDYIWPVNKGYLESSTSLVKEAHALGLEVFTSGFGNDLQMSYNFSYDPTAEYLKFVDNANFSVDGVLTDFPITASESIACLAHTQGNRKQAKALVISHNGASGIYPGSTDLAYQQAVSDGTDVIDCSVQMSKDGVAFCLDSIDLTGGTNAVTAFMDRSKAVPEIQQDAGVFSFDLSWTEIQSLKPQMQNPGAKSNLLRNPAANNQGKLMTLSQFLDFAKNSSASGILINIENAPYLASKKGLDIVKSVSDALTNASFDKQTEKQVFIQSDDTAVLSAFKTNTSYKRVLMIKETVSSIPVPSVTEIKQYADAVSINRFSVTKRTGFFLSGFTDVAKTLKKANLTLFIHVLRNEFIAIPYDYFSDPIVEIDTYINPLEADGIVTEFPSTASRYLRSPCVNPKANLEYTIVPSTPGQLVQAAGPGALPPAEAPAPILDPADVVDPPLPPVVAVADQSPEAPGPATTTPAKSGQPANVAGVLLSLMMVVFSFVQLRG
ncbi:Glycerophosphodiester phosphodiesterase [Rhynchospora pubera]|uniref:glycerophosphodiester phosphodiesterase n=1 Tax=Rhynchospora pubera TaxID=906938 RepID=A0AAV8H6E4_9POAL|nr:Glycerophosphodiester phosphodiesterase [Rhynchospora pubera]